MTYLNMIKQFITREKFIKIAILTAKVLFVIAIFTVIPVGTAKNKIFDTRIALDKNQPFPLTIHDKKTVITSGIAKADMDRLNQNPNPEIIKSFIQSTATDYGVDWKLVYAIGYHESGNYNSSLARSNNNYFGRKAGAGGYASWSTPEEGIRNQCEYIRDHYYSQGLTTPAAINPIYAEDGSWCIAVQSVMNTL